MLFQFVNDVYDVSSFKENPLCSEHKITSNLNYCLKSEDKISYVVNVKELLK